MAGVQWFNIMLPLGSASDTHFHIGGCAPTHWPWCGTGIKLAAWCPVHWVADRVRYNIWRVRNVCGFVAECERICNANLIGWCARGRSGSTR